MPLSDGELISGYTIVRLLGSGGMGEVYLARHPRLPRHDALKVLSASVSTDDEYRQRFDREADIAATLWHPHIVAVHDRGDFDGRLWISMDHVEGTDTAALLADRYPDGMPPDLVIRIVTAVGEALDYAHQRGLLHRDVKPANILIADPETERERIMLADFGIARRVGEASNLTGTNMTVGTVAYSAPEQLTADTGIDGRADQYALAATAYQLLTGTPPFRHTNPAVVISAHLTAQPPPISVHRPELSSLGTAFDKALAKSPADRFDRCVDFARALAGRSAAGAPGGGARPGRDDARRGHGRTAPRQTRRGAELTAAIPAGRCGAAARAARGCRGGVPGPVRATGRPRRGRAHDVGRRAAERPVGCHAAGDRGRGGLRDARRRRCHRGRRAGLLCPAGVIGGTALVAVSR